MATHVPSSEHRAEPVGHGRHQLGRPLGEAQGQIRHEVLGHGAPLEVDDIAAVGRVHLLRVDGRHRDLVVVPLEVLVQLVETLLRDAVSSMFQMSFLILSQNFYLRNVDGLLAETVLILRLGVGLENLLGLLRHLLFPRQLFVLARILCSAFLGVGVFNDGGAPSFPVEVENKLWEWN